MKNGQVPVPATLRVQDAAASLAQLWVLRWRGVLLLTAMCWLAYIAAGVVSLIVPFNTSFFLGVLNLQVIPAALFTGAVATYCIWGHGLRAMEGARMALTAALQAFVPLLILLVVARIVITIGTLTLILPGLAIIMLLTLAVPIMMAERPGLLASVLQSVKRSASVFGPLLGCYIIFLLTLFGAMFATVFVSMFAAVLVPEAAVELVVFSAMGATFTSVHTVFCSAIYLTLRYGPPKS